MSRALRSPAVLASADASSSRVLLHMETFDVTPTNASYKHVSRFIMS